MQQQRDGNRPLVRYIPEYGPIEAVLGYGFFYFLVDVGTPVVQAAVVDSPIGIDPGFVPTAAAGALWFILILTILGQVTEQRRKNPHRFEDEGALVHHLEAISPSVTRMQGWALALVIGLVITVFGFDSFLDSYRLLLSGMVVFVGTPESARVVFRALPWFIVYMIGFSLVTRYTDRLVLGWDRRRRLERHTRS